MHGPTSIYWANLTPFSLKDLPLGRLGFDIDIANAVAFLASELACYITGVHLDKSGPVIRHCNFLPFALHAPYIKGAG
jgi:NAD(P)-dependent dehydrogenase (short-subunit alcohol dehydrogenase family)